jgi:hypothetical protein
MNEWTSEINRYDQIVFCFSHIIMSGNTYKSPQSPNKSYLFTHFADWKMRHLRKNFWIALFRKKSLLAFETLSPSICYAGLFSLSMGKFYSDPFI